MKTIILLLAAIALMALIGNVEVLLESLFPNP